MEDMHEAHPVGCCPAPNPRCDQAPGTSCTERAIWARKLASSPGNIGVVAMMRSWRHKDAASAIDRRRALGRAVCATGNPLTSGPALAHSSFFHHLNTARVAQDFATFLTSLKDITVQEKCLRLGPSNNALRDVDAIVIRDCYAPLFDAIMAGWRKQSHFEHFRCVLTGVPGIGKSMFGFYFLWRLLTSSPSSLPPPPAPGPPYRAIGYAPSFIKAVFLSSYVEGQGYSPFVPSSASPKGILDAFLICDSIKLGDVQQQAFMCPTVMISSPQPNRLRQFVDKASSHVPTFYMPPNTREELVEMSHHHLPPLSLSPEEIQQRARRFYRMSLETDEEGYKDSLLDLVKREVTVSMLYQLDQPCLSSVPEDAHSLFQILPIPDGTFQKFVIHLPHPIWERLVADFLVAKTPGEVRAFVAGYYVAPQCQRLRGILFEGLFRAWFPFPSAPASDHPLLLLARPLTNPGDPPLPIPLLKRPVQEDFRIDGHAAAIVKQDPDCLLLPGAKNSPVADALLPRASVNFHGLLEICNLLEATREDPLNLVFVVPAPLVEAEWQRPMPLSLPTAGKTPNKKRRTKPQTKPQTKPRTKSVEQRELTELTERVRQYVLGIDPLKMVPGSVCEKAPNAHARQGPTGDLEGRRSGNF
ncbi:hypothetical protein PAPYR_7925 [Paratrimastix pyriformis]|uniref:Uncharacterized protein n=1 Tax=Paratrimastix pyriformis TaxID=342808 RepID=A0ABQ8UBX9_9EUKA|nr:hypothetical protein PAPYR_7925 [Paratrimastix pyriformis]